jgi:hypothetical protein
MDTWLVFFTIGFAFLTLAAIVALVMLVIWLVTRPPHCTEPKHEWGDWLVCDIKSNSNAFTKISQRRICKHCGYIQFNRSTLN